MNENARGIIAMIIAMAVFTVGDVLMKIAGERMPVGQLLFLRNGFASAVLLMAVIATGQAASLTRLFKTPVLARNVGEVTATVLFFWGLMSTPFAVSSALGQAAPLAVTAGAALFLGEKVGWRRWLATAVGFLGVLLIVRPGSGDFTWGAVLILISVLGVAIRDLVTRTLAKNEPSLIMALGAGLSVCLFGLLLGRFETWVAPTPRDCGLIAMAACTLMVGYLAIITAARTGDQSVSAPFRYTALVLGVLSGIAIFGERLDVLKVAGIALILGAGLYTWHRETVRAREDRS